MPLKDIIPIVDNSMAINGQKPELEFQSKRAKYSFSSLKIYLTADTFIAYMYFKFMFFIF